MLRAIIFDFDGVIVDSEPLILNLTQQVAAREGWTITPEEYYRDYLALDDRGIVEHLYRSHGRLVDVARREELVHWKARRYQEAVRDGLPAMPGAVDFVLESARHYVLAIASGSLREEVEPLLRKLNLWEKFSALATADDCERSKPDPAVYLKAVEKLRKLDALENLQAKECLAIEDAPGGVRAAHAAGMRCLALAHSRPLEELHHADWAWRNFAEVDFKKVRLEYDGS
ncbi:MAG TPA: HAD family phosphatase [Terriglobia bacterium]|nr:HAD family phosphatase [Terriglobia bacterium]